MTFEEALLYVFKKLNSHWEKTHNDELGQFLSDLSPYTFKPGPNKKKIYTADPAAWIDWVDAVRKLTHVESITEPALIEAKRAHGEFLDAHSKPLNDEDINQRKQLVQEKGQIDERAWDDFVEAVRKTLQNGQITAEQAKLAIVLMMNEKAYQCYALKEIIGQIDVIFSNNP